MPTSAGDAETTSDGSLDATSEADVNVDDASAASDATPGCLGAPHSYGAGLEWISPIGPLKLDIGFPIVKHAGDQYQKFQFQIGTAF